MHSNCLQTNKKKSTFTLFPCPNSKDKTMPPPLIFGGIALEPQDSTKTLGFTLDKKLSMSEQIKEVIKKVRRGVFGLRCAASKLSYPARRTLYNGIVGVHFNYVDSLLNQASSTDLNKLQVEHNKAIRAMCKAPPRTSHFVLLQQNGFVDLSRKRAIHMLTLTYKCQYGIDSSEAVNGLFTKMKDVHHLGTRGAATGLLDLPRYQRKFTQKSFAYQAAYLWNKHPEARLAKSAKACRNLAFKCFQTEIAEEASEALKSKSSVPKL